MKNDRQKLNDASQAFTAEPWIAIYVETSEFADLYLTSLKHYDNIYRVREGLTFDTWKMSSQYRDQYDKDKDTKYIKTEFHQDRWRWQLE